MYRNDFYRTCLAVMATLLLYQPGSAFPGSTAGQLYMDFCSVCHGENGDGRSHAIQGLQPPPRDFTAPDAAHLLTHEYITAIIANGKPGTAMAAWSSQLDSTQIAALADYIRTEFMHTSGNEVALAGSGIVGSGQTDGKRIYDSTCSVCHGDDGTGALWGRTSLNPPPVNFTSADPVTQLPRARMLASVAHGRPGTAMTAFGSQLSETQIAAVVDYIRDTFMTGQPAPAASTPAPQVAASTVGMAVMHGMPADTHAPAPAATITGPDAALPRGLAGNTDAGMSLYMANCTACHGTTGLGDGPRAYFIFPRPRNFLLAETRARLNRPVLFNAIRLGVPGREMPAWSKVLSDQQIADITEYVYRTFIDGETQATGTGTGVH